MINFYLLSQEACIAISIGAAVCVIAQSISVIFNLNRYKIDKMQILTNISESFILAHVLMLSYLIAHIQNSMREDLIDLPDGYLIRNILFLLIIIAELIMCFKKKSGKPLITIVLAFLTLPVAEEFSGAIFVFIFNLSCLLWFIRSVWLTLDIYAKIKTEISALSIKEAIDALETGILFCEEDGYILLMNKRMQELMILLTGEFQRNGIRFYSQIQSGSKQNLFEISELDGSIVYVLPDKSVWMFREYEMNIGGKKYCQISASPVTLEWSATERLRAQNEQLEQRSEELKQTLLNLKSIYMNEETLRMKSHIHDILGQRIAILLRLLRKMEIPDKELLRKFVKNLPGDLRQTQGEYSAEQEMKIMALMFKGIGVETSVYGELPEEKELAKFFVTIITESITNAVRHGFATEIEIKCINNDNNWVLEISNLGILPESPIVEGGGISNIRRRLTEIGGTLELSLDSKFLLMATIPKGA